MRKTQNKQYKKIILQIQCVSIMLFFVIMPNIAKAVQSLEKNGNSTVTVSSQEQQKQAAYVDVNGLVCDFCARALEKIFQKQDAVESIDVDLNKKMVTVVFKQGQKLTDQVITELIKQSGYSVKGIRHGYSS